MNTLGADEVKIALIQGGPNLEGDKDLDPFLKVVEEIAQEEPDFIALSELCGLPSWCFITDRSYFAWAEPISGPTIEAFSDLARRYNTTILVPFFEKGRTEGEYYNSVAVVGPTGRLIEGILPGGGTIPCYRKTHLPDVVFTMADSTTLTYNEDYYFRRGHGLPVFQTMKATIGVLICADRIFPEAWRVLALQGAQIVFMLAAIPSWGIASGQKREELFVPELQVRALENGLFVAACNKGGREIFRGTEKTFFGRSCLITPTGEVIAQGPADKGPATIAGTVRLGQIPQVRIGLPFFRQRRPELYGVICEPR